MNKVQYIKLLNLRGITLLNGKSIAQAVRDTGGNPSDKEMVEVNKQAMQHYITLVEDLQKTNLKLLGENFALSKRSSWLSCLEAAGVDNWEGTEIAEEIKNQREKE